MVRKKKAEAYRLGGKPHDRVIVGLQDELARTKKELKRAHRQQIDDEAIREILGTLADAPVTPPNWLVDIRRKRGGPSPEVPVIGFADWHAGETVSSAEQNGVNEYSLKIMDQRVRRLVERAIDLCRNHGPGNYPGVVVELIGDMVSGGLHPELLKTDEEETIPSCLRVRDLLVWALSALADEFGQVYVPAVCGNHGRQTAKPEFKRYVYKSYDYLIYQMVQRAFADRGDDRIKIDVRPSNDVYYRIWQQRRLLMHGDMLGVKGGDGIIGALGPIMRGEIKTRGWADSSRMPYDMLSIGHWHQELWLPRCTVANTLKGYCEYAKNQLRAPISEPSQPLQFIHPKYGITSRWAVKVLERSNVVNIAEWTSVFDPTKEVAA